MKEFWDKRYSHEDYAYGTEANTYLKMQLQNLKTGKILFPAEGEGRNAVHAATQGWTVSAFDISKEGKNKALGLAKVNNTTIDYEVGELNTLNYSEEQFDAIALIYAHFPADVKSKYHQTLAKFLKKGGIIIFEAFSKKHIEYNSVNEKVGGPKDLNMLYSIDEIKSDFDNFEILELEEKVIDLNEGLYHNGQGAVIRFTGIKK